MQGNQKMEMLVFKNATNPCLIGRDVLATHPVTKQHFKALKGNKQTPTTPSKNKEVPKQRECKKRHCERSSDDGHDEMNDMMYENSATKGWWAKNKTRIDEGINTKALVNMDRKVCKTKVNNSIEKRSSTIDNLYSCENDHQCNQSKKEINAIDCPNEEQSEEQIILVCAIDLVINDAFKPNHTRRINGD